MKTRLECIPCFFTQAIESAKILGADVSTRRRIVDEVARAVPTFPLEASPPEMSRIVYDIIKKNLKKEDPYLELKQQSNRLALDVVQELKQKVDNAEDPLRASIILSIAGNIIDYGVNHNVQPERELARILNHERREFKKDTFRYGLFKENLERAQSVLLIGDNAGEIVLDKLLVAEIRARYPDKKMTYAVREEPIINDATMADARSVGLDKMVPVISSGSRIPGTLLARCNKKFIDTFQKADLIISKGQGNFETLSEKDAPIFFLLMVKCPVVAAELNADLGDIILTNR